ncbi:ABC transporter ATP-binding protein [Candidatus Endoriftia persephonae]|uniref:Lipoprotein-releasing system ATP-binding protein LolD n=3 Tax=Gammaproteobacteria TaxID=1236 RepID=G2FBN1_9GAMM|nr:ABC transporter ATP-binding protein [Candidatus Endoriftia persephone]EGW55712.1 lipoprotein-releasing system ATP-binding protein LolD [endosymbiont of Tevnia jerichonana (vent Tica)]KRT55009.1 ABC-type lipoprotein export system, ATPase component [endosymbiont of Ridgeia piscesae]KRT58009.1 putative ABC transport system ATP-binding protein [endosymbiont of Ridgeia piscesae]USF86302.1 ABC transporter ATP-binding protein [Candidatus Endoriftia persephone]
MNQQQDPNPTSRQNGERTLIYHLRDVVKTREVEGSRFRLKVPSLQIALGEKVAVIGESGSGKSTLLDMLAMILQPTESGSFRFRAERGSTPLDVAEHWRKHQLNQLGDLRRQRIGYVMQTGGLLPYLTVRDNIGLSRRLLQLPDDDLVEELAHDLGIKRHLNKLPHQLSVGERQRVAIGRALAHRPSIVIADEPTASLDPIAAEKIMSLFIELVEELHITVIVASHAWRHINRLGLRHLSHHTRRSKSGRTTETVVTG